MRQTAERVARIQGVRVPSRLRAAVGAAKARQRERRYAAHIRRSMQEDGALFAPNTALPPGYGAGLSERAVEFGWAMAQSPGGVALDAGSTFNHPHVLDALLPRVDALTIVTLAAEPESYPERGIDYVYEDLRALSFPNGSFDTIMSISVLEHVGLDTSGYGAKTEPAADPQAEAVKALRELVRVARPGATILISVPYGRAVTYGWVRTFDDSALLDLLAAVDVAHREIWVYRDTGDGWQVTTLEAGRTAGYLTYKAEAVACIRLTIRD